MLLTKMAPDTFSQPHLRPGVDSVKMSCYKMVVRSKGQKNCIFKTNFRVDR